MKLTINDKGIKIDMLSATELSDKFGTPISTIPSHYIAILEIRPPLKNKPELLRLIDIRTHEYLIHYSWIESINGEPAYALDQGVAYDSNIKVLQKVNELLYGL